MKALDLQPKAITPVMHNIVIEGVNRMSCREMQVKKNLPNAVLPSKVLDRNCSASLHSLGWAVV